MVHARNDLDADVPERRTFFEAERFEHLLGTKDTKPTTGPGRRVVRNRQSSCSAHANE
jgi:hypothetical protein